MPSERTEDATPHTDRFSGVVRVLRGGPEHKRPAALLVVAVLIAAGFAAALGAGYTSAKPRYDSASTDLARGYTIVHINGVSGQTEATYRKALAGAGQSLSIDQLPNGSVAVTNRSTRVVYVIDGASFALGRTLPGRVPGSAGRPAATPTAPSPTDPSETDSPGTPPTTDAPTSPAVDGTPTVVVSGDTSWLVYLGGHQVFRLDPRSNAPTQGIDVGHTIGAAAAGDDGALVVLGADGAVIVVEPDGHRREQNPGGAKDGAVTRVGDRTYVITTDGTVLRVDTDEIRRVASTGLRSAHPVVGAAGSRILQVDGDTGTLVIVDPVTEEPTSVPLGVSGRLGPPVEFGGRVYVPVYGPPHKLIVVDASTGSKLDTIDVPGSSPTFTLKVDGGRLWANDQFDQRAVVIGSDGGDQVIDKGAGPGTTDSSKKPGQKPTTKPTTKPTQQKPGSTPPVNRPPVNVPTTPPATTPPRTGSPSTKPVQPTGPPPVQKVQVPTVRNGTPWQDACAAIQAVGQLKCNANPGGTDHDEDSGTVYDVNPRSGSAIPVGSTVNVSYVGQLKVPNEIGVEHAAACTDVGNKGLTCKEKTDPIPATSLEQYGKVSAQNPQAGSDIDKKDDVTLTWRDKIAMPNVTGQDANQACQALQQQYLVSCTPVEGDPGKGQHPGNTVESSNPAPNAILTAGKTAVTLRYWAGHGQLTDHRGPAFADAQNACNAEGFNCQVQQGVGAPSADKVNTVYDQNPGPGDQPFGTTVTLTFYTSDKPAPNAVGRPYAAGTDGTACNEVIAQGFQCNAVAQDAKRVAANVVYAQNPAAGTGAHYGDVITVYWTPVSQSVGLDSYKSPTQLLATGGAGGLGDVYVGQYHPNNAREIHFYQCPVDDTCSTGDHSYYSVAGNVKTEYVDRGVAFYVFPTDGGGACGAGQKGLWRIWTDTPGNGRTQRNYTYSNAPGPQNYTELLGCVWA